MKRVLFVFLLTVLLCAVLPCGAQISKVDPILIDTPNPWVFECTEDLVLEMLVEPRIDYETADRLADDYFLFLTVEFLYLQERPWNGLDRNCFVLKHTDKDGTERTFPLNFMMTASMSMRNSWHTMSDPLTYPSLRKLELVFDVDTIDHEGWSLIFRPAERGGEPVCELEIPMGYHWWE